MVLVETYVENAGQGLVSPFFDAEGYLHVVSERTGDIYHIDEKKYVSTLYNSGGQPSGAWFGHDRNLYVADHAYGAVIVLLDGKPQVVVRMYEEKLFKGPHSIVFDSQGVLYFTDSGPFGATGLTNPKGSLFCIIHGNQRNSQILKPLALGCLAYPTGLALSHDERYIYVAEMMTNRLLRFSQKPAGVYHASVFHQFSGGMGPSGVAVGKDGTIYVSHYDLIDEASPQQGRVSVLAPAGGLVSEIAIPAPQLTGIVLSPDGRSLYVTESSLNNVYRIEL